MFFMIKFALQLFMLHLIIIMCLVSPSVFPWVSWPLQFWRFMVNYFVECPSIWVCLKAFSFLDWDYSFCRDKLQFSSHHIKWTDYKHELSLKQRFGGFSTAKWLFFLIFKVHFMEESYYIYSPQLWELYSTSLKVHYPHKLFEILLNGAFVYCFIYLLI